jgi:hypothetical protein
MGILGMAHDCETRGSITLIVACALIQEENIRIG